MGNAVQTYLDFIFFQSSSRFIAPPNKDKGMFKPQSSNRSLSVFMLYLLYIFARWAYFYCQQAHRTNNRLSIVIHIITFFISISCCISMCLSGLMYTLPMASGYIPSQNQSISKYIIFRSSLLLNVVAGFAQLLSVHYLMRSKRTTNLSAAPSRNQISVVMTEWFRPPISSTTLSTKQHLRKTNRFAWHKLAFLLCLFSSTLFRSLEITYLIMHLYTSIYIDKLCLFCLSSQIAVYLASIPAYIMSRVCS
ncbi:hypothetical protein ACOME3_009205 [Neoechinorhynchus agilis]